MQEGESESGEGAVRVRHILYSPNDDPENASKVAEDDPAWAKAEQDANAAYAKLKADPSQFDALARAESDEGAGGHQPAASCRTSRRPTPSTRRSRPRSISRASCPASCSSRSSRPSAGT